MCSAGMLVTPETYPGTTTYINKLGLKDGRQLSEAEATLTDIRLNEYRNAPLAGLFDLKHLKNIHYQLFQDLYEWAGEIRGDNIRKGICEFAPAVDIEKYAQQIFTELANENYLQDLAETLFSDKLAYYYDLINRLHPFPEGNGRTQRLFIEHLATNAGYTVDWANVHAWEIEVIATRSFEETIEPTIVMFKRITSSIKES